MFRRIVLLLITILLTGLAISYALEKGMMRLQRIDVVAEDSMSQSYLFKKVKTELDQQFRSLNGKWIWDLSLDKILQMVEADKRVESAHVIRDFPNVLKVVIKPQQPLLAVLSPQGEILPVAPDATLLPAIPEDESPDFPILRGPIFFQNAELRGDALSMLNELPTSGIFSRSKISEIRYTKTGGFSLILNEGGVEVKLGEGEFGRKASRIEKVLNYLDKQQIEGRVIDARFNKKVVVRLRNAP